MNAYIDILKKLTEKIPCSYIEQKLNLKDKADTLKPSLKDICFFDTGPKQSYGIAWIQIKDNSNTLFILPFKLSRHQRDTSIAFLNPWSLSDASNEAKFLEDWAKYHKKNNPITTYNNKFFLLKDHTFEPSIHSFSILDSPEYSYIRYDSQEVTKIYKSLNVAESTQTEVELLKFLSEEQSTFKNFPKLIKTFEYFTDQNHKHAVALTLKYIPNDSNLFQEVIRLAKHARYPENAYKDTEGYTWKQLLLLVEKIAKIMSDFHKCMLSPERGSVLSPVPPTSQSKDEWLELMSELIESKIADIEGFDLGIYKPLIDLSKRLKNTLIKRISQNEDFVIRLRIHGDPHLGQMLISHNDIYLLDFGSEKSSFILNSSNKQPCLFDVACFLLSLNYAWHTTEQESYTSIYNDIIDPKSIYGKMIKKYQKVFLEPENYTPSLKKLINSFMKTYSYNILEDSKNTHLIPADLCQRSQIISLCFLLKNLQEISLDLTNNLSRSKIWLRILQDFILEELEKD